MDLAVLVVPIATAFVVGYTLGASKWRNRMREYARTEGSWPPMPKPLPAPPPPPQWRDPGGVWE